MGRRAARAGALADQVAFELGDAGENGHDHLARVGGVGLGLGDELEARASRADAFDGFKQVAGGASQSVEIPDRDRVAQTQLTEYTVELGSILHTLLQTKDSYASP